MAIELMPFGYNTSSNNNNNNTYISHMEEKTAVQEAASGLESVGKLIKLLSQQQRQQGQVQENETGDDKKIEIDCRAEADVAVTKFKKVISLLDRTRTGHARFRRAPVFSKPVSVSPENKVYCPTPIQQIPPPVNYQMDQNNYGVSRNGVIDRKDSVSKTISFSYSPAISRANSFISSLTGDTDIKQQVSSSSGFQIGNMSQVSSSVGKPPLSACLLKRKCSSSENGGSGKCSGSSGRCHCSKRR